MKTKLYIITFLGVAIIILAGGYAGMNFSLKYMQTKYIELQLDANKRQAQSMAKLLENQLSNGVSQDDVKANLQKAIAGTEADKGFLCMFDKNGSELVCHPNEKMLGMQLPDEMKFENNSSGEVRKTVDVISEGVQAGGIFHTKKQTDIAYMVPVKGTDWVLSAHENIAMIQEEISKQRKMFFIGFFVLSIITALLSTFMARMVASKYEKKIEEQNKLLEDNNTELQVLNNELNQHKEEITAQRDELERHQIIILENHNKLKSSNDQIKSSIQYARRIQEALLPPDKLLEEGMPEHFVFYRPRDIVSGDFYWFKKINNTIIFAVADCTGHGVPGAFMSMLGIAFLNEIVTDDFHDNDTCSANLILNDLRTKVKNSLRQNDEDSSTKDGMDISLVIINLETKKLQFSGAYNPLYIVRDNEIIELAADRMPVGVHLKDKGSFTNKSFEIKESDTFYMFSDGYIDQFGGEKGRKFLRKRFRKLLSEIANNPMKTQEKIVADIFDSWKKEYEQVDDILVAGFKI